MNDSPFIRLAIPFILGMCGADLFLPHLDAAIPFAVSGIATAALFFFLKRVNKVVFVTLMSVAAFSIGMALYTRQYKVIAGSLPTDTTFVCGIVAEKPIEKPRSTAVKLRQANGIHIIIYIGDKSDSRLASINVGDTLMACISHLNPTLPNGSENASDSVFASYRRYLFRQSVCATAYTPPHRWICKPQRGGGSIVERLRALQDKLHDVYAANGIDGVDGSIIEAMTIGKRDLLDKTTRQHYSQSGASHVLALSGFHLSVILFVLQWLLLSHFATLRWRWLCNVLIIGVLWGYVVIAGSAASLVRAATMCSIMLVCQSFTHQFFSLNTLMLTATVMLCYNPMYLYDVGFQLSFVSVLGIVLVGQPINSLIAHTANFVVRFVLGIVAVSFVCFVATSPLVAYYFGQVPVYGVLTNLIITLLVTLLIYCSLLWWLLVGWWTGAAHVIGSQLMWLSHIINAVTEWVAALPCATIKWQPNVLVVLLLYAMLLFVVYLIHKRVRSDKSILNRM